MVDVKFIISTGLLKNIIIIFGVLNGHVYLIIEMEM